MVENYPYTTKVNDQIVHHQQGKIWLWIGSRWTSISSALGATIGDSEGYTVIRDVVFPDSSTVFVAVGKDVNASPDTVKYHFYICEGQRPESGTDWTWTERIDLDPAKVETRFVNKLSLIPNTNLLMVATKVKGTSAGGLFPVDTSAWEMGPAWLGGDYTGFPFPTDALGRLGVNVTSVAVDRLGRYLYAGTAGGDNPWSPGRGGLVRFPLTNGVPGQAEILAGDGAVETSVGDVFEISGVNNFYTMQHGTTQDWEFCTRINDIAIDPSNPRVAYVAVGPGNIPFYHANFGAWRVADSGWTHIWGGNETGSGAKTVGISPVDYAHLYVGSVGQEFFRADIAPSAHPVIADAAEYPVLADATGAAHAIGVQVVPAPNTTIEVVTADMRPWGGAADEPLLDGVAPDLVVGDGIYTSRLLSLDFGGPGTISIGVFAQASDGGYASRAVALEVIGNPIAENAVYRFRAGSADASHVLAVAMTSPPAWAQVTANLASVNGPTSIALADNGLGEDVKAADGIFTSPRFAASMPDVGTYSASVTAVSIVGGPVTQSVNMVAIASVAKFKSDAGFDETERLGEALATGLSARPYSSIYFRSRPNDDQSKSVMITTFDDNATPPGIWGRALQFDGSEGRFESRAVGSSPSWILGDLPAGSRGICYADFDNDGDTDFFLCNPTYGGKLYVNHLNDTDGPADWRGKFVDQTADFFGADTAELAGAITASWGDYTGDGFVDLFVAKAFYSDPIDEIDELPSVASGYNGGDLRLFKNYMGTTLRESLVWGSGSSPLCLAGCWLDLDGDGDLDLVTTRYMSAGLSVLENQGINAAHTDHIMAQVAWTLSVPDIGANSITVIDYDHNAQLDLLITEYTAARKQAWVLRNNYGSGQDKSFTAIGFGLNQSWNGAVVADFNLDGQDDFVLLPRNADVVPALLMSSGYMQTPEFEGWPEIQPMGGPVAPTYRDLGYTLGIRDGRTGGGYAADLDGDHAPDLFLGRDMMGNLAQPSGEQCLYRSTGTAGTANHWLQVDLRTRGNSNGSLIGTTVQVVAGTKKWRKVVDGGSFRGGQGSNDLLFGLGSAANVDTVRVVFPSGDVETVLAPTVNSPLEVWEEDMDALTYARPGSALELEPGFMGWVFRWKTGAIKGDLRLDKVEIYPYGGNPNDAVTLQWGAPNVNTLVYRDAGLWIHELHLNGLPCIEGTQWTFRVSSSAGVGGTTIAPPEWKHAPAATYCLPENYGQ